MSDIRVKSTQNRLPQSSGADPSLENGTNAAILTRLTSESNTLLIAFGSMRLELETPPFEFINVFKDIPAKQIFIRDLHQFWYQRGLPGIADTPEGVADYLLKLINQHSIDKVVTFGGSMGGYASLYFAWRLEADEAYAFSPKTFLSPMKRIINLDFRRKIHNPLNHKILELQKDRRVGKSSLDMKKLLQNSSQKTRYYLYYSTDHRLDKLHCERMKNIPGIDLRIHNRGRHHILTDMKDSGMLDQIIRDSL